MNSTILNQLLISIIVDINFPYAYRFVTILVL